MGEDALETGFLENAVAKISGLLSIGFGQAGASIIASSIVNGGKVNDRWVLGGGRTVVAPPSSARVERLPLAWGRDVSR